MIGTDAFCPESGAPLSEEHHHDETGRPLRAALADEYVPEDALDGRLTAGAVRSSRTALYRHFRRCHDRHRDPDDELFRAAALALRRLKRAASDRDAWDVHVWFALRRRLEADGYEVAWMGAHAEPRCPDCHGRLRYRRVGDRVTARCGTRCAGGRDRLPEIRERVADIYAAAFDERPSTSTLLRF